jgi:Tol biopolymer transport system component
MKHRALTSVIGFALVFAACNVWRALSDCENDSDCASTQVCAKPALRCVPSADITDASDTGQADSSDASDAPVPDTSVDCERLSWGPPRLVLGLQNEPVVCARFSPDETTAFVVIGVPPVQTDIFAAVRQNIREPLRVIGPVANVNEPLSTEFWPTISADAKQLFFESSRAKQPDDAGVYQVGQPRIWSTSRTTPLGDFERPRLQQLFNVQGDEAAPYLHPSGRSLYFASNGRGGKGRFDIFVADINPLGVVTEVRNVEGANSTATENAPVVSLDERFLYHNRPSDGINTNENDIFVARRSTAADGFGRSVRVPELSSAFDDYPSWVAPDHCRIYLTSNRPNTGTTAGNFRLWVAERIGQLP